jgi:hypothetical protein
MEEYGQFEESAIVTEEDIANILGEYHKKQLIENVIGPSVSLVFHVVLLITMLIFIVTDRKRLEPPIMVQIVELEEIILEPEVLEEIKEVEEVTEEEAPVVDPTEAPSESVGAIDSLLDVSDDAPMTDDSVDADELLDVVRTESVLKYSGPLGGRTAAGRAGGVKKYGGSKGGQLAVNKALRWLAKVQNADGSWGSNSPAHTGIALLVFLAHGETPLSEQYGKTVQMAMRWLANYATDEKTMSSGIRGQRAYGHGIATYAISESYAMTKIPFMQTAMERAVDVIVKGQQPGGGFDYAYAKGERWDLSVSGWQFQALKAARVAGSTNEGIKKAIEESIKFMRKTAYANYTFGYTSAGGSSNLTGAGTVGLQLLGAGASPEVKGAIGHINSKRYELYNSVADKPQDWMEVSEKCLYGWYYDTQAIFNAQDTGSGKSDWKKWREVFEKVLIRAQNPEGYWETKGHIGGADIPGRVLATCFSALQLEVYYRYLPTFDIKKMDEAAAQDSAGIDAVGAGSGGLVIEID